MRRTPLPAPVDPSGPPAEAAPPLLLTFRAPSGVPFTLDVRIPRRWDDALLDPPDIEMADVRAVTLTSTDEARGCRGGWR